MKNGLPKTLYGLPLDYIHDNKPIDQSEITLKYVASFFKIRPSLLRGKDEQYPVDETLEYWSYPDLEGK